MKCKGLLLGTGYAETASWSQFILVHPKGFKTIQDALIDVHEAFVETIKEINDLYRADEKVNVEDIVEEAVRIVIHGNYQEYSDLWEHLTNRGWLVGNAWIWDKIHTVKFTTIDRADELVYNAKKLTKFEADCFINCPKGMKKL